MNLSIIVCGYNVEKYIEKTLQSLFEVNIKNTEIIVINDGSVDDTEQILEKYVSSYPVPSNFELKVINFENNTQGGVATAANYGLNIAKGELIAFIDGDDWIAPDAFNRAVSKLSTSDADFIFSENIDFWMSTGEYLPHPDHNDVKKLDENKPYNELQKDLLKVAAMPWRKIYRRSFLNEHNIRFPEGDYFFEDNPFHWMVVTKSTKCLINKEATHYYRMGNPNQTVIGKGEKFLKMFEHYSTIKKMLSESNDAFDLELSYWLYDHILYVSDRTHYWHQVRFYNIVEELIKDYSEESLVNYIEDRNVSKYGVLLLMSILNQDKMFYLNHLEE